MGRFTEKKSKDGRSIYLTFNITVETLGGQLLPSLAQGLINTLHPELTGLYNELFVQLKNMRFSDLQPLIKQ